MKYPIGIQDFGDQQYDRRCQRHDLRWCVEQLRDEGFDQCFGCVESGVNGAG